MVGDSSPGWQLLHHHPSEAQGMDSPVTIDTQRHEVKFQDISFPESFSIGMKKVNAKKNRLEITRHRQKIKMEVNSSRKRATEKNK